MSHLMDILLEDRRLSEDRPAAATRAPVSRADLIIEEGEHKRTAYRAAHSAADPAMIYGSQIGYLHAQVRMLADECDVMNFRRNSALEYLAVVCAEVGREFVVGFEYARAVPARLSGPPEDCAEGAPEMLYVTEVRLYGVDLAGVLTAGVLEAIEDSTLVRIHELQAETDEVPT